MAENVIPPRATDKKIVYVKMIFTKISNVDTIKGYFNGDIIIAARWKEPKLDNTKETKSIDVTQYWNPELQIQNIVSETSSIIRHKVKHNEEGEAFIIQRNRVKGTFTEKLELNDFPFDCQDMTISLTSKYPDEEVDILPDYEKMSYICSSCFMYEREWELRHYVELVPRAISKEFSDEGQNKTFPGLDVHVMVVRKYAFFMWNIIVIMTLISSLPITTFAIDRNNPQRRLLLGFILALTGVAFRFMANQNIPKVPYQTLLDKYLLASMMYNYIVCVWHVVVSRYDDAGDTQREMDLWAFVAAVILYVLIQILFSCFVIIKIYKKNKVFTEKEKIYKVKRNQSIAKNGDVQRKEIRNDDVNPNIKDKMD